MLYADLGVLINQLKSLTDKAIAIITNGALLSNSLVRNEIKNADIVLPSLDASNENMFKKINRPHGSTKFDDVLKGIESFSHEYEGQLWIEAMIVKGINDNREFFLNFKKILKKIDYDKLYINSPVRPPAETFVEEPSKEAISILGGISIAKLVSEGFYSEVEDDYEAVLSIIKRHPMNQFEIESFIKQRNRSNTKDFFKRLKDDNNIEIINYKDYNTYRLK